MIHTTYFCTRLSSHCDRICHLVFLVCHMASLSTPQAVLNTLSIGASLLLPPLRERTELLLSLLPQGPQSLNVLSKGQVNPHCPSLLSSLWRGDTVCVISFK